MSFVSGLLNSAGSLWNQSMHHAVQQAGRIKTVIEHGLSDTEVLAKTGGSFFLFLCGTKVCVYAYKDFQAGNRKRGFIKGALGVITLASGFFLFKNTWQSVAEDVNHVHCRWWFHANSGEKVQQYCNAYGCDPVIPREWKVKEDCPLLKKGIGENGFRNVYEMQKAPIRFEYVLSFH